MKKKTILSLCSAALCAAMLALPVSAEVLIKAGTAPSSLPAGTLIYSEDFEGITEKDSAKALKAVGYTASEGTTAKYSIENGVFSAKNNADGADDSYLTVIPESIMKEFSKREFTVQYDLIYRGAANLTRYAAVITHFNGGYQYYCPYLRIGGEGYLSIHNDDIWKNLSATDCIMSSKNENSAITKLFGEKYDASKQQWLDRKVTIRIEMNLEKGPQVFMNGVLVAELAANKDLWGSLTSSAVGIKIGKLVDADLDNIMVWTGLSDEPIKPAPVTTAASTTAATSKAPAVKPTAPQTFDVSVVLVAAAAVSAAAGTVVSRKKK